MYQTFKMMKSILTGKEKERSEQELINEYREKLSPNILSYFYCNNTGLIYSISRLYPILDNEDKASFCLQELDNCLRNYNNQFSAKFTTYFTVCYKNRLLSESEKLLTNKRKSLLNYTNIDDMVDNVDLSIEDIELYDNDILLETYNLSEQEKKQCKLLNMGYTIKEIAKILKTAEITIYKRNTRIKQKILNFDINFV